MSKSVGTDQIAKLTEFEKVLSDELSAEAAELKRTALNQLMFLAVLLSLLGIVTVIVIRKMIHSMTDAVTTIEQTLVAVASGDLTMDPHQITAGAGDDEFGNIARATASLVTQLQKVIGGLSSASAQLAAAAEESSVVTAQTFKGIQRQQQDTLEQMHFNNAEISDKCIGFHVIGNHRSHQRDLVHPEINDFKKKNRAHNQGKRNAHNRRCGPKPPTGHQE